MTTRQLVDMLVNQGHSVKFITRKDGGIRITSINGERFKGSSGNVRARALTGETLSTRRATQLETIRSQKGQWGHRKVAETLDKETIKRIQKLQRIFRKQGIKRTGIVTRRNYRYVLKHYGKEEAERRFLQAERYALGYAYEENVQTILDRITMDLDKNNDEYIIRVYNMIQERLHTFKEEWISVIYDYLYEWERGTISGQVVFNKIASLLV